ncbi:MAG: winged helix-turn-helix transcriptional regulator [Chloroflexi bacterium]|nr:winged helix-turn-helix transcriptional regulator [Chloroflexota bacterium]
MNTERPRPPAPHVRRARERLEHGPEALHLRAVEEALCDPTRLRIVQALGDEELTVGALAGVIGRKLPATSQHLRVLRELGVVTRRRRGNTVYYRLAEGPAAATVRAVLRTVTELAERSA